MFDMGFEPQVMRIITNSRPDRQIVMFSATFPPQVERVARLVLKTRPLVIVVGGRTKPSSDIEQFVEVRESHDKFPRLLQLLGDWYDRGNILVFVKTQETCDKLFHQLLQSGYRCLSLHGGKDQVDRDFTIQDFKAKKQTLMVATSVAGRGLDVADLCLVINYDVPNHLEDYIHRIGRTGRAGKKGTAYTFISRDEEKFAPDLVKALTDAKQNIPPSLAALNDAFMAKIGRGEAHFRNSGYRGQGFTFQEDEKTGSARQQDLLRREQEVSLGLRDSAETGAADVAVKAVGRKTEAPPTSLPIAAGDTEDPMLKVARIVSQVNIKGAQSQELSIRQGGSRGKPQFYSAEVEFNDYPQQVRYKITHLDQLNRITDLTGCALVPRGVYVAPGRSAASGEKPLHLLIEGPTEYDVSRAANEIHRVLEETTMDLSMRQGGMPGGTGAGRYSVI